MAMYDNENTVRRSFDMDYISEYLVQAQWAEMVELKKVITELFEKKQAPLSILDIGIGNARVPKHLSRIKEIWDKISLYDGTDNATACVEMSEQTILESGIQDKVTAYYFDAVNLAQWQKQYDIILTTWFTGGNFYPAHFSFDNYQHQEERLDLSFNPVFDTIFSAAFQKLNPEGEIILGACYIDNDFTRQKQEDSYQKMGMTIITDPGDTFTATKEGFWSQRFTLDKLIKYFHFVPAENISTILLDTYQYAMQVRVKKMTGSL